MISVPRIAALLAVPLLAASVLGGCSGERPAPSAAPAPAATASASDLASQGRFEEAAAAWLDQAASAPDEGPVLRLRAAEAWWRAGRLAEAHTALLTVDPDTLGRDLRSRWLLLLARVELRRGATDRAFEALPPLPEMVALPESLAALELAVRVAREAGRVADEIRFRLARDARLADPGANREALWELLRTLPAQALRRPAAPPGEHAAGWFELARLERAHRADFAAFSVAIRDWRRRHPDHPAAAAILPRALERVRREDRPPRHVALLLPLSGPFASAAAAVRDGFLAGWYAEASSRPTVSIYDTGAEEPAKLFRAALAAGADFVVGPLRKEVASDIASLADRSVPLLLLNALEKGVALPRDGPPVYRVALSPEDEARAVADFAHRNGYLRAGLLVPDSEWGERVAAAFVERWEGSGAIVAGISIYRGAAEELAEPVRELLEIDAGVARAARLRRALGRSVAYEPVPRNDLDFVFLIGFPREARLLRPQIIFVRAPDLPIYATSHVFTGVPDPQSDRDLDGIVFNDMPWVLERGSVNAERERIVALWPAASEEFTRYYAFGLDAYRLQGRIHRLAAHPGEAHLLGQTGRLTVGADRQVRIEMQWARFRDGVPVPERVPR